MKYISALIILLTINSCNKTDVEEMIEFPSTLYLNKISTKSQVRLFTDKREITDKVVIENFLKNNGGLRIKDTSFVSQEYIKFFSPDSAEMSNSFKSLLITKNENQLLFTLTNKVIVQREDIQKHYNMLKHKDEFEPVWNNQWMGYNMLVGYGNYSKLDLPRFEYIRVSWNTLRYPNDYYLYPHLFKGFAYNQVFNEFDESYVSSISKSDTLAIREYLYSFSKR